jgi:predicted DNA-binding helix-hairpin-helix protein
MPNFKTTLVSDVKFPVQNNRIQWRLRQWNPAMRLEQLDALSVAQLLCLPGIGRKSANSIVEALRELRNA